MPVLHLSFGDGSIVQQEPYVALSRQRKRFEWFALLAYLRTREERYERWVQLEEIGQLPLWTGRDPHDIGTVIGRNIQKWAEDNLHWVAHKSLWRGPYRLNVSPDDIVFDVPPSEAARLLGVLLPDIETEADELLAFTNLFYRAIGKFISGRLGGASERRAQENFQTLAEDESLDRSLRLFALVWLARVFDRRGRFTDAARLLDDAAAIADHVQDPIPKSHYFLARAWQRSRSGATADNKADIARARACIAQSVDQGLAASAVDREGFLLAKIGLKDQALAKHLTALRARIFAGDFERIQVSCHNIGEALRAMGEVRFGDAQRWQKLAKGISEHFRTGRDRALAEISLATLAIERKKPDVEACANWLCEANEILKKTQNPLGWMHYYITDAARFRCQNDDANMTKALVNARKLYRQLDGYDWQSRDADLEQRFGSMWLVALREFSESE